METELGVFSFGSVVEEEEEEDCWRTRSPRMTTSCWMTDLPARTMWGVPWRRARREILLPVSCKREVMVSKVIGREGLVEGHGMGERTVSMYSPRAALFGGMLKSTTTSHASCCKQESSQVRVQLFHTCTIACNRRVSRRGKCTGLSRLVLFSTTLPYVN
jgi:hypothetical protein